MQAFQSGARGGGGALKAPSVNRCVKSGGPEIDESKLKRISQETFDEVVEENIEEISGMSQESCHFKKSNDMLDISKF